MSALATLIEKHLTTLIKTEGQGKKKNERQKEREEKSKANPPNNTTNKPKSKLRLEPSQRDRVVLSRSP